MERRVSLGCDEGVRRASTSAITAPPPVDGEVRRTALPDTFDGIRFEIGRMIEYVKASADDPVVVAHTRALCEEYLSQANGDADAASLCLEAIDQWCRKHFAYVNDPPNIEVLQTSRRMIKQTKVPAEVIRSIIEPFYGAMEAIADRSAVNRYVPAELTSGDCDEAGILELSQCAAAGIRPPNGSLRFRFGGHDGTLHHVWSYVLCGGNEWNADLTESDYALGEFSKFEHYEEVEVPL